jgi:hypothetical protein
MTLLMFHPSTCTWHDLYVPSLDHTVPQSSTTSPGEAYLDLATTPSAQRLCGSSRATAICWLPFLLGMPLWLPAQLIPHDQHTLTNQLGHSISEHLSSAGEPLHTLLDTSRQPSKVHSSSARSPLVPGKLGAEASSWASCAEDSKCSTAADLVENHGGDRGTDSMREEDFVDTVVSSMRLSGLVTEASLLRTSMQHRGEQWDSPNCWPPLLCMWVDGLLQHGGAAGKLLAMELAQGYLRAVQLGLQETGYMWEKYDAERPGQHGAGGEYTAQVGFGWSNGVALHFMATLGFALH